MKETLKNILLAAGLIGLALGIGELMLHVMSLYTYLAVVTSLLGVFTGVIVCDKLGSYLRR